MKAVRLPHSVLMFAAPDGMQLPDGNRTVARRRYDMDVLRGLLGLPDGVELLGAGMEVATDQPGAPLMLVMSLSWPDEET